MAILFRKTISVLVISQLVFPPSLLMAMDSGRDDGASANRQASSVSPVEATPTTTAPDRGQAFKTFQSNNSGVELSSIPLVMNPSALSSSGNVFRNNLGTTLAVVCPPPSPSVSLVRSVQEVDDTQFSLNPLTSSGSSQRENETNLHSKKTSRFKSESLDITTLGVAGSTTTSQQNASNPFVSDSVTTFLNAMGWTVQDLQDHNISLTALHKILPIEARIMPNFLRWASIDRWGARLFHLPLLDFGGLGHSTEGLKRQGKKSWSRFWLQGRSLPLKSGHTLRKAVASDAFREGLEFGVAKGLNLTLAAILMYQITQPSDNIIAVYQSSSTNSVLALSSYFKTHPAIFSVFAFPPVYGLLKAVSSLREIDASLTLKDIKKAEEIFDRLPLTFWNTYLRGLLPFHPLRSSLQKFEQRLVWEGRQDKCGQQEREAAYQLIEKVARQGKGFTQTEGFYGLARLAYGLNLNDLPKLRGAQDNSSLLHRLSLKTRAFESLITLRPDSGLTKLYQDYYLWSLGHSPSFWKTSIPMATMKTIRLATQVFSLWAICKAISDYFNCPDKPGLSFTGYQPWSSSYSQSCFDELVRQFNVIPGQPANTLVDVISQYHFSIGEYALDFSGKGIEANVLIDIIKGFQQHYQQGNGPIVTDLNLGGNNLGTGEALIQVLSILPDTVKTLGLSSINTYQTTDWNLAMAKSLSLIPFVTDLDLSNNNIGYTTDDGTIALGQSLANLTALTYLDLNNNYIGYTGDTGTVAIAKSLGKLTSLSYLDLGGKNYIGYTADDGTIALGQSLANLTALTYLDLNNNWIGYTSDRGTTALGQGIVNLKLLQYFDLTYNNIGTTDDIGTVALGQSVANLTDLTYLGLSLNKIGLTADDGTIALGQGVANLHFLSHLDLSKNSIGFTGRKGIKSLINALHALPSLQFFKFLPNTISIEMVEMMNGALRIPSSLSLLHIPLSDPTSVKSFFQTIPFSTSSFDLSSRVVDNKPTITALMQALSQYPYLTRLDLSNNGIGLIDDQGTQALGQGLANLTSLIYLNLSHNALGYTGDQGTKVIGKTLTNLQSLNFLDLMDNWIGYIEDNGTMSIGKSLSNLRSLKYLDLSWNSIGQWGDEGTQALGQSLSNLRSLTYFNLSLNSIGQWGDEGTQALGQSLSNLRSLKYLDLHQNQIGYTADDGTTYIGRNIFYLTSLIYLNLGFNSIGQWGDEGTQALGQSLGNLTNLGYLDLSLNSIGKQADIGTVAIGTSLDSLINLRELSLASNYIGTTGKSGSLSILSVLPQLATHLDIIRLNGLTNISWTQGAQALSTFTNKKLAAACESQLCHGTTIKSTNKASNIPPVTSSASRLQAPWPFRLIRSAVNTLGYTLVRSYRGVMHRLSASSPLLTVGQFVCDSYDAVIDDVVESLKEVTANSPAYFPNIHHSYISDWQPNPFTNRNQQSGGYATLAPYVLQQSIGGGYLTFSSVSN